MYETLADTLSVKHLANQTGRATGEISEQIASIQDMAQRAAGAIRGASSTIGRVDQVAGAIAAAVAEQQAATRAIIRSVEEAAAGGHAVSERIQAVSGAVEAGSRISDEMRATADNLANSAGGLRQRVEGFLVETRKVDR